MHLNHASLSWYLLRTEKSLRQFPKLELELGRQSPTFWATLNPPADGTTHSLSWFILVPPLGTAPLLPTVVSYPLQPHIAQRPTGDRGLESSGPGGIRQVMYWVRTEVKDVGLREVLRGPA